MRIKIIRSLADMNVQSETHPCFRGLWSGAGSVGRMQYVINNPTTPRRAEVDTEVEEIRADARYARYLEACDIYDAYIK